MFTCSTAVLCCLVESSISRAASVVVVTSRTIALNDAATSPNCCEPASTAFEPVSVAITVVLTDERTSSISVRISLADSATRSASLRISSATTAKRLPASPAPAASIVALIDRMLVCSASSETMSSTEPISCDFLPSASMWLTIMSTCRRMAPIESCAMPTVPSPDCADVAV